MPIYSLEKLTEETMAVTRKDVVSALGPVDDAAIAEIMSTGATADELREAWAWALGDEALINQGRPLPGTRVAALIDLIEPAGPT